MKVRMYHPWDDEGLDRCYASCSRWFIGDRPKGWDLTVVAVSDGATVGSVSAFLGGTPIVSHLLVDQQARDRRWVALWLFAGMAEAIEVAGHSRCHAYVHSQGADRLLVGAGLVVGVVDVFGLRRLEFDVPEARTRLKALGYSGLTERPSSWEVRGGSGGDGR